MENSSTVIQHLVDSLCQCFGDAPKSKDSKSFVVGGEDRFCGGKLDNGFSSKRRTRSLAQLGDTAWEGLFSTETCTPRRHRSTSMQQQQRRQGSQQGPEFTMGELTLEQAQAVAKAKLAASYQSRPPRKASSSPGSSKQHRKRTRSRDDIFRSKREPPPNTTNAFSRFLTSNPVIMNSLCFATPIRGDSLDMETASVVSDSNTLNTAEDTITSTLYYETTKLAGLQQKNPPMPLFNNFAVEAKDDIHTIVTTRSHSSFKMMETYKHQPDESIELEEDEPTPPSSPNHYRYVEGATDFSSEVPPPISKLSSDSSKS